MRRICFLTDSFFTIGGVQRVTAVIAKQLSMYYDVTNSRMTEIDKLNGQILTIAYKNKLDVPYTEFVVNAIKGMEKLY